MHKETKMNNIKKAQLKSDLEFVEMRIKELNDIAGDLRQKLMIIQIQEKEKNELTER